MELDGNPDQVSLIRWDTTSIPSGSTVTSVSLTFNVVKTSQDDFEVYRALRAWDEQTATYQLAASGQPAARQHTAIFVIALFMAFAPFMLCTRPQENPPVNSTDQSLLARPERALRR